jgi:hypothetical protein
LKDIQYCNTIFNANDINSFLWVGVKVGLQIWFFRFRLLSVPKLRSRIYMEI